MHRDQPEYARDGQSIDPLPMVIDSVVAAIK